MKQSDITPEVIRLSKEIAKHWRMDIYKGCWVYEDWDKIDEQTDVGLVQWADGEMFYTTGSKMDNKKDGVTPIPSISDCLEKLRELGWYVETMHNRLFFTNTQDHRWDVEIAMEEGKFFNDTVTQGKTLHEALLSALLEVVDK